MGDISSITGVWQKTVSDIIFTTLETDDEIRQLLSLQQENLPRNISAEEARAQGFVTVEHHYELMRDMNEAERQVIARDGDKVVGYCLVMLPSFVSRIPVLEPMFSLFDSLQYRNRSMNDFCYFAMGQVCVDKAYRGMGVFDGMYLEQRNQYREKYDFVVTEIATRNTRSMRAHERIGFETVHQYRDATDDWAVVIWDWQ